MNCLDKVIVAFVLGVGLAVLMYETFLVQRR